PRRKTVANFIGDTDFLEGKVVGREGERVMVETAIGRFEGILGDPSAPPAIGTAVTLSIRPECWSLGDARVERNAVRGRIGESVYLGEIAQYDFLVGDVDLKIYELNPRHMGATKGELYASVEPEDVVVLTA
ncbi:MAG TPA: spermidine/putrescine ABC transporter ATP-binding protein, partial [Opitutaceae bacterium]|nr:spermidine/putrescine ABC transporter ATP-binding protein [Opitutaceae bacterium]